jgi:hypothetical protein
MNTPNIPIMPFVILVLFLLPIKLQPQQLKKLAFSIWMAGGVVLTILGVSRLMGVQEGVMPPSPAILAMALVASIVIGVAKGKFVLGKTATRNLARLNALTEPQKPIHVYCVRSWVIIALMVGISVLLNSGVLPLELWLRGAINIGIGLALVVSSFNYVMQPKPLAN